MSNNIPQDMRIVFMGTPEFAVHSLKILVDAGYNIVGVITAPDRYGGRGRKTLIESDVKKYAVRKELNILQPTNLKNQDFLSNLKNLQADIQIVVAFRMLPAAVWDMPPFGTYNLHGSLLPKYRGAAPINWAIIKGEIITGVTSFKLKHKIDTGSICLQKEIPIYQSDNAGDLHDRMKYIAADTVYETVEKIKNGTVKLFEQKESEVSHAPKLHKENTKINFDVPVDEVYNFVRGLDPYPTAWMPLGEKQLKVFKIEPFYDQSDYDPGTITSDNKTYINVYCKSGYVSLKEIQYTGKKRMKVKEFLNGFDVSEIGIKTV